MNGQTTITIGTGGACLVNGKPADRFSSGDVVEVTGPAVVGGYGPCRSSAEVDRYVAKQKHRLGIIHEGERETWKLVRAGCPEWQATWKRVEVAA